MSAHAQRGLPAFSIYGKDVKDMDDRSIPDDVATKILRFAQCALGVGQMRNKAYVAIGSVGMGIAGSFLDPMIMQRYFGIRAEWVDMVEIMRRIDLEIYDKDEYETALSWAKKKIARSVKISTVDLGATAIRLQAPKSLRGNLNLLLK